MPPLENQNTRDLSAYGEAGERESIVEAFREPVARLKIPIVLRDPSALPYLLREGGRYRASGECLSRYGARGKPCGWKCMSNGGGVGTAVVSITSR
eukprot:g4317.t1